MVELTEDDKIIIDKIMIESFSVKINNFNLERWLLQDQLPKYLKKPLYGCYIVEEGKIEVKLVEEPDWDTLGALIFEPDISKHEPINELYGKTITTVDDA